MTNIPEGGNIYPPPGGAWNKRTAKNEMPNKQTNGNSGAKSIYWTLSHIVLEL